MNKKVEHLYSMPNRIKLTVEDILERNANYEFNGLIFIATTKDNLIHRAILFDDQTPVITMIGAIENLKIDLKDRAVENDDNDGNN